MFPPPPVSTFRQTETGNTGFLGFKESALLSQQTDRAMCSFMFAIVLPGDVTRYASDKWQICYSPYYNGRRNNQEKIT